jgi:hypothetical protein
MAVAAVTVLSLKILLLRDSIESTKRGLSLWLGTGTGSPVFLLGHMHGF